MNKYRVNNGYRYHPSEYTGVCSRTHHTRKTLYIGSVMIDNKQKRKVTFKSEREAAKWVDMQLIIAGKEPKNILKRI